jgi:hypothetical protein
MGLSRIAGAAKRRSAAKGWITSVTLDSVGGIATIGTMMVMPFMSAIKVDRETDESTLVDGNGATVATDSAMKGWNVAMDFLQADKDTFDFVDAAETQAFMCVMDRGIVNGKHQYWCWAYGKISGATSSDWDDWAKVPIKFMGQKNAVAQTINTLTGCTGISTWFTSFTVPAEAQKVIIEINTL